jgi:predicted hydrocarbon binding protein
VHGVIFLELNRFVDARLGSAAWMEVIGSAGLTHPRYAPTQIYPDGDLQAIVAEVSRRMGLEPQQVLEEFGTYVVPSLATLYSALIDADWTLLEMLEHTESTIHRVVRIRAPGAAPPQIRCRRLAFDQVEILYSSDRRLCAFARGILRGLAALYEQPSEVTEPECMLQGSPACRILVKASPPKGKLRGVNP